MENSRQKNANEPRVSTASHPKEENAQKHLHHMLMTLRNFQDRPDQFVKRAWDNVFETFTLPIQPADGKRVTAKDVQGHPEFKSILEKHQLGNARVREILHIEDEKKREKAVKKLQEQRESIAETLADISQGKPVEFALPQTDIIVNIGPWQRSIAKSMETAGSMSRIAEKDGQESLFRGLARAVASALIVQGKGENDTFESRIGQVVDKNTRSSQEDEATAIGYNMAYMWGIPSLLHLNSSMKYNDAIRAGARSLASILGFPSAKGAGIASFAIFTALAPRVWKHIVKRIAANSRSISKERWKHADEVGTPLFNVLRHYIKQDDLISEDQGWFRRLLEQDESARKMREHAKQDLEDWINHSDPLYRSLTIIYSQVAPKALLHFLYGLAKWGVHRSELGHARKSIPHAIRITQVPDTEGRTDE